jgi:integrase
MAKRTDLLKAKQINNLADGFHSDGGNLYLRVKGITGRSWVFRYKKADKVTELGLGSVISRSLAQAREIARKMRTALADGGDPADVLKVKFVPEALTFKTCALAFIESKRAGWRSTKHAKQWESTLEQYAYPIIGGKLPAEINLADVKAILSPIWATKTETASRLRQRIESVLDYAAVHDEEFDRPNPARWKGVLNKVLPKPTDVYQRINHPSVSYADVPALMATLRDKDFMSAFCLCFHVLTAARSGEARGAVWSEINFDEKVWTIPAARMKAGKLHRVPLCDEALKILETMQSRRMEGVDFVFPGTRGGLLSDVAINKTLHSVAPGVTVHGFRSSFRVWGAEQTSIPREILEVALAHVNSDETEKAYQRSDLFERRRELMLAWGRFCAGSTNVVRLVSAA